MFVPQVDQPCHDKQKIGEAVDQCLTHRVYGILIGIMQGNQDALDPSGDGAAVDGHLAGQTPSGAGVRH